MANTSFDEKIDNLISRSAGPRWSIGPDVSPYALVPRRDPNDALDRFVFGNLQKVGFGPVLPEGYEGKPAPGFRPPPASRGEAITGARDQLYEGMGDQGFTDEAGAIEFRRPGFGRRLGEELRSNLPGVLSRTRSYPGGLPEIEGLREASMSAMGVPRLEGIEAGMNLRFPAQPPGPAARPGFDPNSFGAAIPSGEKGAIPAERNAPGDITLAANRGPASGYSHNPPPDQIGNYEYGGKFNGRDVWFWKPQNDMETIFNNARAAILEYQRRNPNDPMVGAIESLLNAMNISPNAESARNLQGAHADLYRAQTGAIPSEIEERRTRAGYYGRPQVLPVQPGVDVYGFPAEGGAIKLASGREEKPAAAGAAGRMNEFDKVLYQAAAHIAQNSLDPDQQKLAFEKMDEIERKYGGPRMDRSTAYAKLKAIGKYTDDQINAKLDDLGLR